MADVSTRLLILAADAAPQGGLMDLLFPLAIVFLIFYVLVIRPAGKERRAREDQVRNVKKNDKVVTNAGIHGKVVGVDPDTVTLCVDDKNNVRIKFSRQAIWQVNPAGGGASQDAAQRTAAGSK